MRKHCENTCPDLYWIWLWASLLVLMLLLSGCTSDEETETLVPVAPPIDLSGVWGGTWSGNDPTFGPISGNWEAELTQNEVAVSGLGSLSGDIDCADGPISGSMSKQYVISGDFVRDPCGTNLWLITALSLLGREVGGLWTKPSVNAEGTFTGIQVATPTGPRIRYFYPPGGLPGTVVAVTGERFAVDPANNALDFDGTPAVGLQVRDSQRIIANVPSGATIGPMTLTRTTGATSETGHSVLSFNTSVTHPTPERINSTVDVTYSRARDIAITPNGRRAFVTYRHGSFVTMLDVANSVILNKRFIGSSVQAIVVSPDSKYAYVSTASEIIVLHAGLNQIIDRIAIFGGDTVINNPDGLAITPDGKSLLVADNRLGGAVSLITVEDKSLVDSVSFGAIATPYGIVVSPDGLFAYIAVHGLDQVKEYSLETYSVTNTIDVGISPTGLAIIPDGSKLYVSNEGDNTVSVIDLVTRTVLTSVAVGTAPVGVAASPDGARIYVANYASDSVSIIDAATDTLVTSLTGLTEPVVISILPDGLRGYISNAASSLGQIGGPATLTVLKSGSGLGYVSSSPEGIDCGSKCRAEFPGNTIVTLTAAVPYYSIFDGWSGDCTGTNDSVTITMDSIKNCTATFSADYPDSSYSPPIVGPYSFGGPACFVATATYGSYLDPNVKVLREFRDEYLLETAWGRAFVDWYYENSPPLASHIAQHEGLRLVARLLLTPVVYGVMYPVAALMLLLMIATSLMLKVRRKRLNNLDREKNTNILS